MIVPLGTHAARHLFQQYGRPLPSSQTFSGLFGRLVYTGDQRLLPLPHPAGLLYQPAGKSRVSAQHRKLSVLLNACRWSPVCPMKRYFEAGRLDGSWIALYCKGDWQSCIRYQMIVSTEGPNAMPNKIETRSRFRKGSTGNSPSAQTFRAAFASPWDITKSMQSAFRNDR